MSSILETFVLLFESDGKDFEKDVQRVEKTADDAEKSLKKTALTTQDLGLKFVEVAKQATLAFVAFQGLSGIMQGFNAAVEYADKLGETSEALGISVEQLDLWSRATIMAGGSADDFASSIKSISTQMTQLDTMGKSKLQPFLKELGINLLDASGKSRPALEIFPELADAFQKMSKQEAIGFGQKIGLSEGVIMLLQKGRREVDALIARQKELGVLTERETEVAGKYKDSLDELSFAWRNFAVDLSSEFLPAFTWAVEKLTDFGVWAQEHSGFLKGFFAALTAGLAAVALWAFNATLTLTGFWSVLLSPITLAVAGFALLAGAAGLLWDDFAKWKENPALSYFQDLWVIVSKIVDLFKYLSDVGSLTLAGFTTIFTGEKIDHRAWKEANAQIEAARATRLNAISSNAISSTQNKQTTVNVGEVKVETQATDAEGIAKTIGGTLNSELTKAQNDFDDGVKG